MATAWRSCVIMTQDVARMAAFWRLASGLRPAFEGDDEVVLTSDGTPGRHPGIVIMAGQPSSDGAVHIDINSDDMLADLSRLLREGATLVADHGEDWKMLHDPDGNPFCLRGPAKPVAEPH